MLVRISSDFWSDPDIEEMPSQLKLAALWVLTNSRTTLFGFVEVSKRRFEFETGSPYEALAELCKAHPKGFKAVGGGIWVRNFIRYQIGAGEKLIANNFCKGLVRALRAYQGLEIFNVVLRAYPELSVFFDAAELNDPDKGLPSPREERRGEDKIGGEEVQEKPADSGNEFLLRARRLFRMRDVTPLDSSQKKAWEKNRRAVLATTEEDWGLLEWWYAQEGPAGEYRRRDLATLLNNWNAEITRAAETAKKAGGSLPARKQATPAAFEGWEAVYERVMGDSAEGIVWDRLPETVQRRLIGEARGGKNE
jgi:hypothetical protein